MHERTREKMPRNQIFTSLSLGELHWSAVFVGFKIYISPTWSYAPATLDLKRQIHSHIQPRTDRESQLERKTDRQHIHTRTDRRESVRESASEPPTIGPHGGCDGYFRTHSIYVTMSYRKFYYLFKKMSDYYVISEFICILI
jgi:hypothetical protein